MRLINTFKPRKSFSHFKLRLKPHQMQILNLLIITSNHKIKETHFFVASIITFLGIDSIKLSRDCTTRLCFSEMFAQIAKKEKYLLTCSMAFFVYSIICTIYLRFFFSCNHHVSISTTHDVFIFWGWKNFPIFLLRFSATSTEKKCRFKVAHSCDHISIGWAL